MILSGPFLIANYFLVFAFLFEYPVCPNMGFVLTLSRNQIYLTERATTLHYLIQVGYGITVFGGKIFWN